MRSDWLVAEGETRVVQVDVVELLANHQVGKEAALGGDEISTPERHLEFVAEPGIVRRPRVEIAGSGAEMEIPAGIVEARDVGADLRAGEGLALLVVTIGVCRIDRGAALSRDADRIRAGRDVHLASDAPGPDAATGLVRGGIGWRRHEGAALLGQECRIDAADRRGNGRAGGAGRNRQRADIVNSGWSRKLRGGAVLERRGDLSERAG